MSKARSDSRRDATGVSAQSSMLAVLWTPHLHPLLLALLTVVVIIALVLFFRRLRQRLGTRSAWWCWWPKAVLASALLLALADPQMRFEGRPATHGTLGVLVDTSSSMDVDDGRGQSRYARATGLIDRIRARVPGGIEVVPIAFDTRLRGALPEHLPAGLRPGDPGVVLQSAASDPRLTACVGLIALTDGGDEAFTLTNPPAVPLSIIGLGRAPDAALDNLAISDVVCPATVEVKFAATIQVDLTAAWQRDGFRALLDAVPLVLEERQADGSWSELARQTANLANGRARLALTRTWTQAGSVHLRLRLADLPGEASTLDNVRELNVTVREQSLHVLYFTRELGLDFKTLRQELARDGGLTFTALFRTLASKSLGDRYTLQGDRLDGDAALERGFPTTAEALRRYGVIVVGSFAASGWKADEQEALVSYVEQGGAVVFLGGEQSFGAGGYGGSALAPLMPATLGADALERGAFPVSVPGTAAGQSAVAGLSEALGPTAVVESLNRLGALRPGATVLLEVAAGGRPAPLVAVQGFGRGKGAAVASNTLWKLARPGADGSTPYGLFWRQFVRALAEIGDQGSLVRVQWDREHYRPGDTAIATILPNAGAGLRLATTLTAPGGTAEPVPLEAAAETGVAGAQRAKLRFSERGDWQFRLVASQDGRVVDTLDRSLTVGPLLGEGNRLGVDHAMLAAAAKAGGGTYAPEADLERVLSSLATSLAGKPVLHESALVGTWWFLGIIVATLLSEWWARRRRNMT